MWLILTVQLCDSLQHKLGNNHSSSIKHESPNKMTKSTKRINCQKIIFTHVRKKPCYMLNSTVHWTCTPNFKSFGHQEKKLQPFLKIYLIFMFSPKKKKKFKLKNYSNLMHAYGCPNFEAWMVQIWLT